MRTEYTYTNGELVKVGDVISLPNGGEAAIVRELRRDALICISAGATVNIPAREIGRYLLNVKAHFLPEVGYFHLESGIPIQIGDVLAGGIPVHDIHDGMIRYFLPDSRLWFTETDPTVENHRLGIEIRIHPTHQEINNGLPRVIVDGVSCVTCGGELVPVSRAVWIQGSYHRIEDCFILAGMENTYITDIHGTIELPDGRRAYESECAIITFGPRTGEVAFVGDIMPTGDGFIVPRQDVTPILNAAGQLAYYAEVPTNIRYLNGQRVHESDIIECSRTGQEIHMSQSIVFHDGTRVSRSWAENNATTCEECGNMFESNDETCDCPRCRQASRTRIRNYSCRSASSFKPEQNIPIKFGIELEVGCDRSYDRESCTLVMADAIESSGVDISKYAIFKEDGSLSSCNGFEVVTRPDSPAVHKRIWRAALADHMVTKYMSSYNNGKCGIHIHVSRAPLTDLWIGRLLVLINSIPNRNMIHKIAGRGQNDYTRYYVKKFTDGKGYGYERYESLNLSNDKTIEFRMFRGTLNRDSFIKNIEFVEAALEFTRPASRSLRDMSNPEPFLEFVSKSRKSYPHLFAFLKGKGMICKP